MIETQGFHHLAVQVRDVERVTGFYREVLGLPELTRHRRDDGTLRSVWLGLAAGQTDARAGFLAVEAHADGARGPLGFSVLALRIAPGARASAAAHLAQRGVAIERETGWTIFFRDPEGNLVGLSHHPDDQV